MSKLIGTNPNQVPSNADLGSAAFMDAKDFLAARGSSLSAIDAVISKTAVDVFIYDTSLDSDGGAWRKRTQHTSWYNEKLNTTIRGSRREFPAVAIIVSDNAQYTTIFDADDPTLPMWMMFDNSQYSILRSHGSAMSLAMLNGKLMVGLAPNDAGISEIDFISDSAFRWTTTAGYTNKGTYNGSIAERNQGKKFDGIVPSPLSNIFCNGVAMKVLPNSKIDPATGLPRPTIAIATGSRVNVIKDDKTVVTHNSTAAYRDISFAKDHLLFGYTNFENMNIVPINEIDYTNFAPAQFYFGTGIYPTPLSEYHGAQNTTTSISGYASGNNLGLTHYDINDYAYGSSMVAYTTSDYATGWMNGDIRLATLSDTKVNYIEYTGGSGSFSSASEWSGDSQWTVSGGTASYSGSGAAYLSKVGGPVQNFVYGNWYYAEIDVTAGSANTLLLVNRHISGIVKPYTNGLTNVDVSFIQLSGTKYFAVWKQNSNNQNGISLYATSAVTVDNFKVYEVNADDRSVANNRHLFHYGTVKKNPVAAGADLLAYGPFSASNYLKQPYNSRLEFTATDHFAYIYWVNVENVPAYQCHFSREYHTGSAFSGSSVEAFTETGGGYLRLYFSDDGYSTYDVWNSNNTVFAKGWMQIAIVKTDNRVTTYIDGKLDNIRVLSQANGSFQNSNAELTIGSQHPNYGGSPMTDGRIALFRVSATAPSADQIKKMYEDEKSLFEENAKATLYGSSNGITALAYDDSTNLLHAGTSAGRSVFQGFRRIDNTTDAVDTALSVANGMVVEE